MIHDVNVSRVLPIHVQMLTCAFIEVVAVDGFWFQAGDISVKHQ